MNREPRGVPFDPGKYDMSFCPSCHGVGQPPDTDSTDDVCHVCDRTAVAGVNDQEFCLPGLFDIVFFEIGLAKKEVGHFGVVNIHTALEAKDLRMVSVCRREEGDEVGFPLQLQQFLGLFLVRLLSVDHHR